MSRDLQLTKMVRYVYIIDVDNRGTKSVYYGQKTIFYTGQTNDIGRRLKEHLSGRGSKFLHHHFKDARKVLVFVKHIYGTEPDAIKEEYRIKALSRDRKKSLIADSSQNDLFLYVPVSHIILRTIEDRECQYVVKL